MATNLQLYSLLYVRVGGTLLTEEGSITFRRMSNAQRVLTVPKGFAGMSPGAAMCEGRVTNFIPAAGLEFDAGPYIASLQILTLGILRSDGKQAAFDVFIPDDDASHGANQEARYEFDYVGRMPQWK